MINLKGITKTGVLIIALISVLLFSGCGERADDGKITVITTVFPQYDFVRQISDGADIEIKMLLKPGGEAHTYDPTPADMMATEDCDLFIYVGGESEAWAEKIISSSKIDKDRLISLIDVSNKLEAEHYHADEAEEEHEEHAGEYDEHVWTSPENAILISRAICDRLSEIDGDNAELYRANTEEYISQLVDISDEFRTLADKAETKTLVFADRFPFLHLVREYGLSYVSPFSGCSAQAEASTSDVISLIEYVKENDAEYIFTVDFSNEKIAQTVSSETGARILRMNSCHTVSADDMKAGVTYIDLQKRNLQALQEALLK